MPKVWEQRWQLYHTIRPTGLPNATCFIKQNDIFRPSDSHASFVNKGLQQRAVAKLWELAHDSTSDEMCDAPRDAVFRHEHFGITQILQRKTKNLEDWIRFWISFGICMDISWRSRPYSSHIEFPTSRSTMVAMVSCQRCAARCALVVFANSCSLDRNTRATGPPTCNPKIETKTKRFKFFMFFSLSSLSSSFCSRLSAFHSKTNVWTAQVVFSYSPRLHHARCQSTPPSQILHKR